MKRFMVLLILAVLTAGALVTAEESVLIDFTKLTGDLSIKGLDNQQNSKTLVDYSTAAGTGYTAEQKAAMKTSLAIGEWEVNLAPSSRTIENMTMSKTAPAPVSQDAEKFPGETVMGIRVHFPKEAINSYAIVQPPFEIPAFKDADTVAGDGSMTVADADKGKGIKFDNFGVVKNVGVLKSVQVWVRGLNFKQGLSLILQDADNKQRQVFMGYLDFDGWRQLSWVNPDYITEVRNRTIQKVALYPKSMPFVKLVGILINKDASIEGGDFITYVRDISVTYDKAVLSTTKDIQDESIWGILQKAEEERRTKELSRLGQLQVLRYIEKQKMHQEAVQ